MLYVDDCYRIQEAIEDSNANNSHGTFKTLFLTSCVYNFADNLLPTMAWDLKVWTSSSYPL